MPVPGLLSCVPLDWDPGGIHTPNMTVTEHFYRWGHRGWGRESQPGTCLSAHPCPSQQDGELTFRSLWQDAQSPVQQEAGMAAHAGRAAAERMQRNGADDQRQLQEQLG